MYDLIGIGIGPSNLGLAALLTKVSSTSAIFLDKKQKFTWHNYSTSENALLQTNFLKDLVTLIDPKNSYSFLSYLSEKKQLYSFLNRRVPSIYRNEYSLYLEWVVNNLRGLYFSQEVKSIEFQKDKFKLNTGSDIFYSKNIVIGTGVTPNIPANLKLSDNLIHSSNYFKNKNQQLGGKKVIIIGGGQSSAEIIDDILSLEVLPEEIVWISSRQSFFTLQDSSFNNEFYTPNYIKYFFNLSHNVRDEKNNANLYTSDGITEALSNDIYNKIYRLKFIQKNNMKFSILTHHFMDSLEQVAEQYRVVYKNLDTQEEISKLFDIVILSTGYKENNSNILKMLFPEIQSLNDLTIDENYSVQWNNPNNKIFIQNGCKHLFSHADSNISLSAWRNARIINKLVGKEIYNLDTDSIIYGDGE